MKCHRYILLPFLMLIVSCSKNPTPEESVEPRVADYIRVMISIMRNNSINKYDIDWVEFEKQVLAEARGKADIFEINDALVKALELLGDDESYIIRADGTRLTASTANCGVSSIATLDIPENIGYIQVPSLTDTDTDSVLAYVNSIQESIRNQDSENIIGWVVDIRNNNEGSFWPMLVAVGPILGEGTWGFLINADRENRAWSLRNGEAVLNDAIQFEIDNNYVLLNPNPRTAVLLNGAVRKSAEALAVSFAGRENTRSFGQETCGFTTNGQSFRIRFDDFLFMPTENMVDSNLNIYKGAVVPDIITTDQNIAPEVIDYLMN